MPAEVRIWQVDQADALTEIKRSKLDLEARIEKWISSDISLLSPDLVSRFGLDSADGSCFVAKGELSGAA